MPRNKLAPVSSQLSRQIKPTKTNSLCTMWISSLLKLLLPVSVCVGLLLFLPTAVLGEQQDCKLPNLSVSETPTSCDKVTVHGRDACPPGCYHVKAVTDKFACDPCPAKEFMNAYNTCNSCTNCRSCPGKQIAQNICENPGSTEDAVCPGDEATSPAPSSHSPGTTPPTRTKGVQVSTTTPPFKNEESTKPEGLPLIVGVTVSIGVIALVVIGALIYCCKTRTAQNGDPHAAENGDPHAAANGDPHAAANGVRQAAPVGNGEAQNGDPHAAENGVRQAAPVGNGEAEVKPLLDSESQV